MSYRKDNRTPGQIGGVDMVFPYRPDNVESSLIKKHPLQRIHSPSRSISAFVHATGLVSFFYSFQCLKYFPGEINEAYGWHFQFLTIIALSISTLTFIFGFLADITLNPKLFLIKNALAVASAPLEVLISLLYWGLTAIDRTLVMPPGMHIDTFVDLSLHLFPAALLLIDALLLSPPWTVGVVPALLVPGCLATFYWFWLEHCYSYNGWYPYPIMEILKTEHRIILFVGSALTMSASTLALKWAFSRFNGQLGKAVPGDAKRR
ncbi:uncharacterized protein LAJ45_08512 [Morchella importuna]|uniref:uncharacterized protein n=1 Tax=Morchella importuna TaxID=1174673 RepID=UPI001E8D6F75|nr:uncharacterized protein LAJ45_08512 [Morchella importuna]KAH8147356.1 hypothetical protein LAJ45_08512 [Morchella importuna]